MKPLIFLGVIVIASPAYACEMILPGGIRTDASALCGRPVPQVQRPEIELKELSHDGMWLVGRAQNNTPTLARFVKIHWESLTSDRKLLDAGFVFAQPSTILPGQNSPFKAYIPNANGIVRTTRVEWLR